MGASPGDALHSLLAHFKGILSEEYQAGKPGVYQAYQKLVTSGECHCVSTIQKTFTALDAEIRSLANPVSMDTLPLAGEIEDRSTNAPLVVGRLEKILDDLCYILGIELMLAGQAMDLRKGKILGEVTGRGFAVLREKIPFYDKDDRVLTEDIEAVCEMIKEGTFLRKLNI